VQELINYAVALREVKRTKARVLVATPCDVAMPEDFTRIDAFPATPLFLTPPASSPPPAST